MATKPWTGAGNPYRLALDMHGIGFKTADAIAQRLASRAMP